MYGTRVFGGGGGDGRSMSQLCTCSCSDTSVAFWHLESTLYVQKRIFLLFSSDFPVYFSRAFV
jgi:hypothetical protein